MMTPPKNAALIEWPTSTMWFDEDGILYSVPKTEAPPPQSKEEAMIQMKKFRELIGHKKTCMISESNNSAIVPKKEERDWMSQELNSVVKALAIVSPSPLSKMVANLFFGFKPPAYPFEFFENEEDAKVWIKQYL